MFKNLTGLLRSSKPVMVMTAFVAVLGITGTAYGAKLITGLDIKDGSITADHDPDATGVQLTALVEGISSRWLTGQLSTDSARSHLSSMTHAVLDHGTAGRS